jgi:hypothetical protein
MNKLSNKKRAFYLLGAATIPVSAIGTAVYASNNSSFTSRLDMSAAVVKGEASKGANGLSYIVTAPTATPTATSTATPTPAPAFKYKNGLTAVSSNYTYNGGANYIQPTYNFTLTDDIITNLTASAVGDPYSQSLIARLVSDGGVIGKSVDADFSALYINAASFTSENFKSQIIPSLKTQALVPIR